MSSKSTRGTFVVVKHANKRRNDLSKFTKRTLGSGNLREAVKLPMDSGNLEEWIATNIVDFFNELTVLYDLCAEDADKFDTPGDGFPPGCEYRWADGRKIVKPIRCSAPEYVNHVLCWIEDTIHDEAIFPVDEHDKFPKDFADYAMRIFTRMFRIYAIIYNSHFVFLEQQGAHTHLNTSLKHFVFFIHEHGLVEEKEYKALAGPVKELIKEYSK